MPRHIQITDYLSIVLHKVTMDDYLLVKTNSEWEVAE